VAEVSRLFYYANYKPGFTERARKVKTKRTTKTMEITLEKSELRLTANRRRMIFGWCATCGERAMLLPPEEIICASPRQIYQWIENGKVYFRELPDGLLLVCSICAEREKVMSL